MENTAYAIVRTGGKQYRVSAGAKIRVDKLHNPAGEQIPAGEQVTFSEVLFVKDGEKVQTGQPIVSGAAVVGEVLRQFKDKKVIVFKKRSKKGYKKLNGHRQQLTEVLIKSVQAGA